MLSDLESLFRRREELLVARRANSERLQLALHNYAKFQTAPTWHDSSTPEQLEPVTTASNYISILWSPNALYMAACESNAAHIYHLDSTPELVASLRLENEDDEWPTHVLDDGTLFIRSAKHFSLINGTRRSVFETGCKEYVSSLHHGRWISVHAGSTIRVFDCFLECWADSRYDHTCHVNFFHIDEAGKIDIIQDEHGYVHSSNLTTSIQCDSNENLLHCVMLANGMLYLLFYQKPPNHTGRIKALVVNQLGMSVWSRECRLDCSFPMICDNHVVALDGDARTVLYIELPYLEVATRTRFETEGRILGIQLPARLPRFISILIEETQGLAIKVLKRSTLNKHFTL